MLNSIPIADENGAGYNRDLFHYPTDADGNRCDTRAEVLLRDTMVPVLPTPGICVFGGGQWYSAYDGVTTTNQADVEIDHVVALKEAWDSGAFGWDDARRAAYGNDLTDRRTLIAVTASSNQSKGDSDPSNWLPPLVADQCPYIGNWIAIKARWGLSMDQSEHDRIANLLQGQCFGLLVPPIPPSPASL